MSSLSKNKTLDRLRMVIRNKLPKSPVLLYTILLFVCSASVRGQYMLGMTGQMAIPTAEMQENGRLMIGGNYLPEALTPERFGYNTGNYFVNATFLPFLELAYRCTMIHSAEQWKAETKWQQDRSVSGRLRLLKEGRYWPAMVAGTNDPIGTTLFSSAYGVVSKTLKFGGHTLVGTAGWYIPLKETNNAHDGAFAGVRYAPGFCKVLSVMAEYDSQGVNVGAAARLWGHLSVFVCTREFNCLAGGVRYEYTLLH